MGSKRLAIECVSRIITGGIAFDSIKKVKDYYERNFLALQTGAEYWLSDQDKEYFSIYQSMFQMYSKDIQTDFDDDS